MIIYAHSQRNQYDSTPVRLMLCTLVFMDITTFFFLSFMNICFDTIVSQPPLSLMIILFLVMGFDICAGIYLLKRIHCALVVNFMIMVLLILSWVVSNQYTLFLSAFVLIRFWEIIMFNDIIRDKLRPYKILFKLYVVCKIIYLFCVVGHILGCIFQFIDNTLIKAQHYGTIQQNPYLYYQGHLLCYSPIYSLSEINHYLYCMYYIFSLMATVAYGDIIPKNPYENAYVMFLLVFATVVAGFIIEQMLIVFNDYWYVTVFQLRKARYFHDVLKYSSTTSANNRYKLVNYLYSVLLYDVSQPHLKRLTANLRNKIMLETVYNKHITYSYSQPAIIEFDHQRRTHHLIESEDAVMRDYQLKSSLFEKLPNFLLQFLLTHLQFRLYPDHYMLVDNQDQYESAAMFITLRGTLKLGYGNTTDKFMIPKYLDVSPTNDYTRKLLCWRQFIFNNKNLNKYYKIQTAKLCQLLTYKSVQLHTMLKKQRGENINAEIFSNMLQAYHLAIQSELVKIQEENRLHNDIRQIGDRKIFQEGEKQSYYLLCWGCGCPNHMPIQCPLLHYKVSPARALANPHFVQRRGVHERRASVSKKLGSALIKMNVNEQVEWVSEKIKEYVASRKEQAMYLRSKLLGTQEKIIQKYQFYNEFHTQFNMDT